jgi:hypothetical protein
MADLPCINVPYIAMSATMGACAVQWESVRVASSLAVTTFFVWPGTCECGYYANDLPCFDEQKMCADQVWTLNGFEMELQVVS